MDELWRQKYGYRYSPQIRGVRARAQTMASGERQIWHAHEQAQLFYALTGAIRVLTSVGSWMLPPMRAIWLPPVMGHELHAVGHVEGFSVYLEPSAFDWDWPTCRVLKISPLTHELIAALASEPEEYEEDSRAADVVPLLMREMKNAQSTTKGGLPLPNDKRLRVICSAILASPENDDTLDDWSVVVGSSSRTLARLFRAETGLTFCQWRQHLRLAEAISSMALGMSVNAVAETLGYRSTSGFIAMFKRALGETPQRYLRNDSMA